MSFSTMIFILAYMAFFIIFPLYAGIQAWRKERKAAAIISYLSVSFPFAGMPVALIVFFVCKLWQPNLAISPRLGGFSGCGIGFCGATNRSSDGSFLTTEWLRLFGIPIVPIQSYRVSYGGSSTKFSGLVSSETKQYYIHSNEKLDITQIVRTYIPLVCFLFAFLGLINQSNGSIQITLCVILVLSVILAIWFWRAK